MTDDPKKNETQNEVIPVPVKPLVTFFHTVMNRLRERLSPERLTELLLECDVEDEN